MTLPELLAWLGGLPDWALWGGLALATLVSEDLACIAGGLLVAAGQATFGPVVGACFAGIFVGDLLLVAAGRALGPRVLGVWPLRNGITPADLARAERWFRARGARVIFASRFLPGTRLPTYLAAGVLRAPWAALAGWLALACAGWTPLLVGAAALAGEAAVGWWETWEQAVPWLLAAGAATWLATRVGLAAATWRGRRLLLGRWRRLTRWEFWPAWAVYPPIVTWIAWHGLRVRCLTWFTAVNPGIGCGGGLVGESKSAILRGLAGARVGERDAVAAWQLVPPAAAEGLAARCARVRSWAAERGEPWPLVLKPDQGERGAGVVIARSWDEVDTKLAADARALIVQAYVPGVEFGVFYVRRPSEVRGRIFAVTEKHNLVVTGDGRRTLEALILGDPRAVCLAPLFLARFAARCEEVVPAGGRVLLGELGTHCRGALFLDGAAHVTTPLETAVDRVSRSFEGFFFGRYDVRSASAAAFARGEFTVIELNGLTSEATSIYDPRHSLAHGWRVLLAQWRWAAEIAAENRARGVRPLTVRETLALLRRADP